MNGDTTHAGPRPLNILIAGAGIGGLSVALALRQQGHNIDIFEQSKLSQETGAAIHLASNCNGLLRRMGIFAEDIGGVECTDVMEFLPHNNQMKYHIPAKKLGEKLWAHPWHLVHRAHLHTALREAAIGEKGKGSPARLHLASHVKSVDAANATLTLEDGTVFRGDLLIGADGVHSRTRSIIPGGDLKAFDSGKSAFRFLIPIEALESDPQTAPLVKRSTLVMWIDENRRVIMYPCINNTMLNFVCIHPSEESEADAGEGGWQQTGSKDRMLAIYQHFDSAVRATIEKAEDPKVWKLLDMDKMPSFVHEKLALIGDAAHPFLPHQGQGGGQAIEDAVALAALLPLGTSPEDVTQRLSLYNDCRYERAHKIQDFTRTAGKDASELAAEGKKLDMMEYQKYNFGHDAWDFATNKLQTHLSSEDPAARFRTPFGFGDAPGPRRPLGLPSSHEDILRLRAAKSETSETISVRFKTSRTYLENLLPPGFIFTSPGTLASASISCTTLDGMTWLGGGGYSHCGLYIHGVEYTQRDGGKLYGTYLAVLFENLADPIITGRDELGMPKLFCDIGASVQGDKALVSLAWRGAQFAQIDIDSLAKPEPPATNGISAPTPAQRAPGPPLPPPEQGQFAYRYVPAVGQPGKTDAEYAVFIPKPEPVAGSPESETLVSANATVKFEERDWKALPTLHNVARGLAEVPVYAVEEAKVVRVVGVSDVGSARRIE